MTKRTDMRVAHSQNFVPDFADLSDYVFGKQLPQADELEVAVLGACLLDFRAFGVVRRILEAKHFYNEAHQHIYTAMGDLEDDPEAKIDMLTVMEQLKVNKKLDAAGGPAYIASLTNRVGSAANIEYHSRIIYQKWLSRDTIEKLCVNLRKAFDESYDVFDLRNDIADALRVAISDGLLLEDNFMNAIEIGRDMPKLAKMCGELWNKTEVAFLFGPSGTNKSTFAIQIADALSKGKDVIPGILINECDPQRGLYVDFEMNDRNIFERYTNEAGVPYEFDDEMLKRVRINHKFVDFDQKLDRKVYQEIENFILLHKPEFMIIDNITWISSENKTDASIAAKIMKKFVQFSIKYELSLLVIGHTNKEAKNKYVSLEASHLQGSADFDNFAHSIFGIKTSALDKNFKYIKQFKDRNEEMIYEEDHVLIASVSKGGDNNFLMLEFERFDRESAHIAISEPKDQGEKDEFIERCITEMFQNNWSWRDTVTNLNYEGSLNTLRKDVREWIDNKDIQGRWKIAEDGPRKGRPVMTDKIADARITRPAKLNDDEDISF